MDMDIDLGGDDPPVAVVHPPATPSPLVRRVNCFGVNRMAEASLPDYQRAISEMIDDQAYPFNKKLFTMQALLELEE